MELPARTTFDRVIAMRGVQVICWAVVALQLGRASAEDARHLSVLKGPFRPGASMPDWNVGGVILTTNVPAVFLLWFEQYRRADLKATEKLYVLKKLRIEVDLRRFHCCYR